MAFIVCNAEFPSAPAEKAMRYAEFAMRSRGTIFFCEGEDVAQTVIALAEREQIDILIVGTPKRSTLLRRLRRDTVDRIIHAARSFDVVVVADDQRS